MLFVYLTIFYNNLWWLDLGLEAWKKSFVLFMWCAIKSIAAWTLFAIVIFWLSCVFLEPDLIIQINYFRKRIIRFKFFIWSTFFTKYLFDMSTNWYCDVTFWASWVIFRYFCRWYTISLIITIYRYFFNTLSILWRFRFLFIILI